MVKPSTKVSASAWVFFRTYSPQGDGNCAMNGNHRKLYYSMFFRTYSPQGDGNLSDISGASPTLAFGCFSEPIPRKGTETIGLSGPVFPA